MEKIQKLLKKAIKEVARAGLICSEGDIHLKINEVISQLYKALELTKEK